MLTRYPDFNVCRLHYFIVMLRSWEIKKSTKEALKATGWKRRRKKHCANAIIIIMQMRNKRKVNHFCGCTWIHQQRFIACCVPSQNTWAPPRYFLSNKLCVHVHKEIQTITRQKQEHSKPNFKNYQQIRSSSHRIYLFGQFPLQFHLVSYSFYLSTLNIQQPKRTIWNYEFNSNRHTLCNQAKSENKQKWDLHSGSVTLFAINLIRTKMLRTNNIDIFDVRRCYAVRVVNFPWL